MASKTARPSVKLTKAQAAEALARALNLLNDLRCSFGDLFSAEQVDAYHETVQCLSGNEEVRADFWGNGTLDSRDLI